MRHCPMTLAAKEGADEGGGSEGCEAAWVSVEVD